MKQLLFIAALLALMVACKDANESAAESTNEFAPPAASVLEKALEPPLAADKLPADLMPPA